MKRSWKTMCLFVLVCLSCGVSLAQFQAVAQQQPQPPSTQFSMPAPQTRVLPALDNRTFLFEDEANYELAMQENLVPPAQLARPQEVNFNLNNSGTWETLPDGGRVWRLRIVSPGATDTWLIYDQWRIVKPCELYVYNDDRSNVFGPYTSVDNWDGTNVTPVTSGEAVNIEYYVPEGQQDIGEISVLRVLHGYRHFYDPAARERDVLDNFGDSMPCMVNINCFPSMQEEKRAVAMIIDPMGGACSGSMLNNTLQNGDPLFLTANHCLTGNQNNWLFFFAYESPNCSPNQNGSTAFVISNATLLMNHALTDNALLRLSRPRPNTPYIPAYMGWYRVDTPASSSYGIHHPAADVQKGHEDYQAATSTDWNGVGPNTHWMTHIDNGMMEPGSSGSPMINSGGRVVGPLHGGSWDCDPNTVNNAVYGKISVGWEGDGTSSGRLRDWLDPNNSGATLTSYWQPFGPPNDSCGQPGFTTITSLPYSTSGSTLFAANNFNTLNCNTNTSPEVLYMLQLPCDHTVTVSSCGSNYDTQIMVYGVNACMSWSWLAGCNDDFCGTQSQVTFNATGGQLYTIVLEGYGSSWGNFVLNVTGTSSGAQGNAQCPGYEITTLPYFTYGATWCGNDDVNPECRPTQDGQDVHWYWVSPYNQPMRARTCYTNFDTVIDVRYGGACPGTWSAGCNDDYSCGGDPLASTVVFDASAGATYYIHMDGFNGAEGMSSLELGVWNDNCESPYVITGLPFNDFGDTRPAQDDFATVVGPSSKEVFFQYTAPTCQTVYVHTCDDNLTLYDTGLEVRTGGSCPGSTLVAYNDDACGNNGLKSSLSFNAEEDRTYYIIVGGFGTNAGQFMLYVSAGASQGPPAGDICNTAIQIPSLPFADFGNTCCMANNYFPCVGSTSREMVYNMILPTCQQVTVSLCGSGYDTGLGIYGGVCPNISPLVTCNDDNYCGATYTYQSTATFIAEANTNYQILVHGFSTNCGNYVLNASSVPCAAPTPDPVDDLTILANDGSSDVRLFWSATANASSYEIYYSTDQTSIFQPANHILSTTLTSATIGGILSNPEISGFFQVVAVGADGAGLATLGDTLPKDAAVNSAEVLNPHFNDNNEIEEQAVGK